MARQVENFLAEILINGFLLPALLLAAVLLLIRGHKGFDNVREVLLIVLRFWLVALRFGVDFLTALFFRKKERG